MKPRRCHTFRRSIGPMRKNKSRGTQFRLECLAEAFSARRRVAKPICFPAAQNRFAVLGSSVFRCAWIAPFQALKMLVPSCSNLGAGTPYIPFRFYSCAVIRASLRGESFGGFLFFAPDFAENLRHGVVSPCQR